MESAASGAPGYQPCGAPLAVSAYGPGIPELQSAVPMPVPQAHGDSAQGARRQVRAGAGEPSAAAAVAACRFCAFASGVAGNTARLT